ALLGALDRFADGFRHLVGLAQTEADVAGAVAHDHQRTEAEAPAALDHLGHAVDLDDLLLQLDAVALDPFSAPEDRHAQSLLCVGLELQPGSAGRVGQLFDATMVEEPVPVEDDGANRALLAQPGDQLTDLLCRLATAGARQRALELRR